MKNKSSLSNLLQKYNRIDKEVTLRKNSIISLNKAKEKLENEIFKILSYTEIYLFLYKERHINTYAAIIIYGNGKDTIVTKVLEDKIINDDILLTILLNVVKHCLFNKYLKIYLLEDQLNKFETMISNKDVQNKFEENNIQFLTVNSNNVNMIACRKICENNIKLVRSSKTI